MLSRTDLFLPATAYSNRQMLIRITSIVSEEVAPAFRRATCLLEERLAPIFSSRSYGGAVDQFSVVAVCVDDDPEENRRFVVEYDKHGAYRDLVTGARIKYISFALPFRPEEVRAATDCQLIDEICEKLKSHLNIPAMRLPKGFNYEQFRHDLCAAIKSQETKEGVKEIKPLL